MVRGGKQNAALSLHAEEVDSSAQEQEGDTSEKIEDDESGDAAEPASRHGHAVLLDEAEREGGRHIGPGYRQEQDDGAEQPGKSGQPLAQRRGEQSAARLQQLFDLDRIRREALQQMEQASAAEPRLVEPLRQPYLVLA